MATPSRSETAPIRLDSGYRAGAGSRLGRPARSVRPVLGRELVGEGALVPQPSEVDWSAGTGQATSKRSPVARRQEGDDESAAFDRLDSPISRAHAKLLTDSLSNDELISLPDDWHRTTSFGPRYDLAS